MFNILNIQSVTNQAWRQMKMQTSLPQSAEKNKPRAKQTLTRLQTKARQQTND